MGTGVGESGRQRPLALARSSACRLPFPPFLIEPSWAPCVFRSWALGPGGSVRRLSLFFDGHAPAREISEAFVVDGLLGGCFHAAG